MGIVIDKIVLDTLGLGEGENVFISIETEKQRKSVLYANSQMSGVGGHVMSAEEEESKIRMFENYLENMGKSDDRKKRLKEVLEKIKKRQKELKV